MSATAHKLKMYCSISVGRPVNDSEVASTTRARFVCSVASGLRLRLVEGKTAVLMYIQSPESLSLSLSTIMAYLRDFPDMFPCRVLVCMNSTQDSCSKRTGINYLITRLFAHASVIVSWQRCGVCKMVDKAEIQEQSPRAQWLTSSRFFGTWRRAHTGSTGSPMALSVNPKPKPT